MKEDKSGQFAEDTGQTIASMNVEGMPWYNERGHASTEHNGDKVPMTGEERRAYIWAAIRSGLLILLVFAVVFFLFLVFCDMIWFR